MFSIIHNVLTLLWIGRKGRKGFKFKCASVSIQGQFRREFLRLETILWTYKYRFECSRYLPLLRWLTFNCKEREIDTKENGYRSDLV
jgi:hypothetical protein